MTLLLTRQDVEQVLTMKEAIEAVEGGFRQLALGKVTMPQRVAIRLPEHRGLHLAMPASIASGGEGEEGALAVKIVTVYPDNPAKHNLPTTIGTMLLNDPRTGALLAIMDAGFLTAMRTGAASGVATRYLARPEAESVGIFGAGVQARTQLLAMCEVRPIKKVVVCDPAAPAREKFIAEMSQRLHLPIQGTTDPEVCLEAEIVIAASSSPTPVFDGHRLRPGTHINGVGSHSPEARELDSETIRRARVISDLAVARLAEDGDFMVPLREGVVHEDHFQVNLGEVIAGLKPGRRSPDEITLFKSGGLAVQDAATGARVFALARARGVGREVTI
jgi:alanine dehydrogenase